MGNKRKLALMPEELLPLTSIEAPSSLPIFDTHMHLLSTYSDGYERKYPLGAHETLAGFVRGLYGTKGGDGSDGKGKGRGLVEGMIDVWCEAPIGDWRGVVQAAQVGFGDVAYHFVLGVHPHNASSYTSMVETQIEEAAAHPCNVGIGECGLDYHYDNSPRQIQTEVFERQLRLAVRLGKPVTVHTREADEDCWRILKAELPRDWRVHVHCFTDTPDLAARLLDHFPNLAIGITGVVTFTSNLNTRTVIADMIRRDPRAPLRILLETDSPYMVPSNLPLSSLGLKSGQKMPFSTSAVIPWTAAFVADVARQAGGEGEWDADRVMRNARETAKRVYGV